MQNNSKKIQLLLSTIFFIFFVLAFLFLYREININNQQAEQSIVLLENETKEHEEIEFLNRSIGVITEGKTLLETHFAKSSDIVPFLDTVEALAVKAGVKAEVASVDALKDSGVLTVQVNASGNFERLYKFLTLLENSPYELEFASINMQREAELDVITKKVKELKWQAVFKIRLLSFIQ